MPGFVKSEYYVTMLGSMCERFGQRPSEIIGIKDSFIKLDFDMAIHFAYGQITKKYMDKDNKEVTPNNETDEQRITRIKAQMGLISEIGQK